MHLISVTSDFSDKYSLFNGQVFIIINSSHTKITEPCLTYFEQKSAFELVLIKCDNKQILQTILNLWLWHQSFG